MRAALSPHLPLRQKRGENPVRVLSSFGSVEDVAGEAGLVLHHRASGVGCGGRARRSLTEGLDEMQQCIDFKDFARFRVNIESVDVSR